MKAWVFSGAGKPLELQEVPDPVAKPGEVVIDIKASGLCHSDVSALDDPNWAVNFPAEPVVLGHEPAGVVSAVGEGVTNLKIGDRVGVPRGRRTTTATSVTAPTPRRRRRSPMRSSRSPTGSTSSPLPRARMPATSHTTPWSAALR